MIEITSPITGERIQVAKNDFENEMDWHNALQACKELGNGWRLPTQPEQEVIYKELYLKGKGNFKKKSYWSNKEEGKYDAWYFNICDGTSGNCESKLNRYHQVRAVRGF